MAGVGRVAVALGEAMTSLYWIDTNKKVTQDQMLKVIGALATFIAFPKLEEALEAIRVAVCDMEKWVKR